MLKISITSDNNAFFFVIILSYLGFLAESEESTWNLLFGYFANCDIFFEILN